MRLILMLLIAAGGYHYVSQALSERPGGTPLPSISTLPSSVASNLPSDNSGQSWMSWLSGMLGSAAHTAREGFDTATATLNPQTRAAVDNVTDKVTDKVSGSVHMHGLGSGCGQPDRDGNIKYCFNDEK
ncbi:TPA: hypothetical protein ACYLN4_006834 [Burkholderia lata]